jgi:hypothetical protein
VFMGKDNVEVTNEVTYAPCHKGSLS